MRRTKIIATLGPASSAQEAIEALIAAGVDVFRLNLSHGDHESHAATYERIRTVSRKVGRPVGILLDLQGPKIRLGKLAEPVTLETGSSFTLTREDIVGDATRAMCDYPRLPDEVSPGLRLLINDGLVALKVESVEGPDVRCRVEVGGPISDRKGVNIPGVALSIPALTEKDRDDLAFGIELGVDLVALSFVQRAADVAECKALIREAGGDAPVIAKIEKPAALEHLDAILEESWGVMVARGDLGVEMSPEEVPVAQKQIIRAAETHRRVVITATQMLESMRHSPTPTRAEASDVANAIFDGTDAVMLSGETAVGDYPVESVLMMDRICVAAEDALDVSHAPWMRRPAPDSGDATFAVAVARAVAFTADTVTAEAIVAFTRTGRTAVLVSKNRVPLPIIAFTPVSRVLPRLALLRGVLPLAMPEIEGVDDMMREVDATLRLQGIVKEGDQIVIAAGAPVARRHATNMMLVHKVGHLDTAEDVDD